MLIQIVNHACSNVRLSTQQSYFTLTRGIEYVQLLVQIVLILILFATISIKHASPSALQDYSWIHSWILANLFAHRITMLIIRQEHV